MRKYIEEITHRETEMRVIVSNNAKLIETHNTSVKVVDKYIRLERIVPQIIEKVINVEIIVERESAESRVKITETEKALMRKEIKGELREKIKELETNILAYQDLLITKESDIKAYALEIFTLQKGKPSLSNDLQLIASLKQLLAEKQLEIEQLKNGDIRVGKLPSNVFKKLEHVNAQIESKLEVVHKNYKKEILKLTDGFLKEIT